MARLLIHAVGRNPSDHRDWKPGWVVDVKPDDHVWGSGEVLPTFWQVDIPGITVDEVRALLVDQRVKDDGTPNLHPRQDLYPGRLSRFRRKEWGVDLARVPQAILDQLNTTGQVSFAVNNRNQIRNALRRIRDDVAYSGF